MRNIQAQIDNVTANLTALNNELEQINSTTPCNSNIGDCFSKRKTQIENSIERLNTRKSYLENIQLKLSYTFTTDEESIISEISTLFSGSYDKYIQILKSNETLRNTFFANYSSAGTTFEKELIIKTTFRL